MSRVKVKKITTDKSIVDNFHSLLGLNGANVDIVLPKIDSLLMTIAEIKDIFKQIASHQTCDHLPRQDMLQWFSDYAIVLPPIIAESYNKYLQYNKSLIVASAIAKELSTEQLVSFGKAYEELKKSTMISTFLKLCRDLLEHKEILGKVPSISPNIPTIITQPANVIYDPEVEKPWLLIDSMSASSFSPFVPITRYNIKQVFMFLDGQNKVKYTLIQILATIMNLTYKIYKITTTPDINVEAFSSVILSNIQELKKYIPRCDLAFNKIAGSMHLLTGNFDNYYRDFVITKNPVVIMEEFILDVSRESTKEAKGRRQSTLLAAQFAKIVRFYKEKSNGKPRSAEEEAIFSKLDSSFSKFTKVAKIKPGDLNEANTEANAEESMEVNTEENTVVFTEENKEENKESNTEVAVQAPEKKRRKKRKKNKAKKVAEVAGRKPEKILIASCLALANNDKIN